MVLKKLLLENASLYLIIAFADWSLGWTLTQVGKMTHGSFLGVEVLDIQLPVAAIWACNSLKLSEFPFNMSLVEKNINHLSVLLTFKVSSSLLFVHVSACVCVCVALLHVIADLVFPLLSKYSKFRCSFPLLAVHHTSWFTVHVERRGLRGKSLRAGQGFCRCKLDLLILSLCPERM